MVWHTLEPCSAAARYPREMITALTEQGVPIHLICPRNYQFREELSRDPLITLHLTRSRSVDTTRGLWTKIWTNTLFLISSCLALLRVGRRKGIVHFQHVLHFPFSALFFASAKLRGCTVIFTVHDPVPHKWLFPRPLRWIERGSLRWAYNVSDSLIVHSEPGKRALIEYFGIRANKIQVIGRGPYQLGAGLLPMPDSPQFRLLVFGAIRENKGVHLAIEAVQTLYREGMDVKLTIAGDVANGKESSYWGTCLELIAREPAPIRVRKEFIADELLPELFAGCHCLLLPYTAFFSDSGVAFMALANGRPIVATRAGGLAPLLDSAELGVTIDETTPEGVAASIRRAASLGVPELARLGRTGAKYVNEQCGWPKFARQTQEIYESYMPDPDIAIAPVPLGAGGKMNVVLHTPEPRSGAARYVWELVNALAESNVAVSLVCPRNFQFTTELEANPAVTLYPTRERVTCNRRRVLARVRDNLVFLASSLRHLLRAVRPGCTVHFQFVLHFPVGALFFLVSRMRGCKILLTVHDPIPHRWLFPERLRWLERRALAWAYGMTHGLIAHSEPGKQILVEYFGQNPAKIFLIAHGPYDLGSGVMPMWNSGTLDLLVFGSIRRNKGVHLAIAAVQALHAESEAVRLTIAGDLASSHEQSYWADCRDLIARAPVPIVVKQEFVPDEQLSGLLARAHGVLLPYFDFFSDSGVAQIALANGRPILATRSGGLGPLLQQADLGIPIEEISVQGVIDAIRIALRLGLDGLARLGENGAAAVNNPGAGWKPVAAKTRAVYVHLSEGHTVVVPRPQIIERLRRPS